MSTPADAVAVLRSRKYLALLVLAAIVGAPVSAAAWGFLTLVTKLQHWIFTSLPRGLGFHGPPMWWPVPLLAIAGILVALTIRYLPGSGGHSPADGLRAGKPPRPAELPGILLAALATLSLGAVLGPEAPLIALGSGLAVCVMRVAGRNAPEQATAVVAGAGSFAAIATLFGSPLLGAFLLMEMVGLAGASLELVLLPGLLAAGIGALVTVGLGSWSGLGTSALSIPHLPPFTHPDAAELGWAVVIGAVAALLGTAIRRLALVVRPHVDRYRVPGTVAVGLLVAGLAIAYAEGTGRSSSEVLFSGQSALGPLVIHGAAYSVGALVLLVACKGLAYSLSMSCFRGGPVFPALFLGAAGGIAASHLPGLPMVPAVAMGIGAMSAVMLRLPLTSVLLATLLLFSDGLAVTPLAIVAVVVAYLISLRIAPASWALPGTPSPSQPSGAVPAQPARRYSGATSSAQETVIGPTYAASPPRRGP
jgi:chloride channel protein, CIC family